MFSRRVRIPPLDFSDMHPDDAEWADMNMKKAGVMPDPKLVGLQGVIYRLEQRQLKMLEEERQRVLNR